MSKSTSSWPSIAIIGAGPAGLTLARLLQVSNTPLNITIFEKDTSPTSRTVQGGTLDLHPHTGLAAIKAAGLWDEFQKYARYEGEELVIADKNGTELVHQKEAVQIEGFEARPEIDRERLKNLLLESVDAGWVRWGKKLKRVDVEGGGRLVFFDGTSEGPFDLVIGADGGWSKVAQVLTSVRPRYAGICGLQSSILRPNEEYPAISSMVGRGSYFAFSDSKSLMAQRLGDESIKIGLWMKQDNPNYTSELIEDFKDEAKLKERLLEHYQDWVPEMRQWVEVSTAWRPWPLYELPVDHRWEHKKGFTLIGDAAHIMTPFAGEGVNTAMKDALELCGAIVASQMENFPLDEIVERFEEDMFPRMNKVQQDTMVNKTTMYREDAPIGFMLAMVDVVFREVGYDLSKGFMSWLPVKKLAFGYFWTVTAIGHVTRRLRNFWTRK